MRDNSKSHQPTTTMHALSLAYGVIVLGVIVLVIGLMLISTPQTSRTLSVCMLVGGLLFTILGVLDLTYIVQQHKKQDHQGAETKRYTYSAL